MEQAIATVLGDVPASSLGVTLPHEHLYIDAYAAGRGAWLMTEMPLAVAEVNRFRAAGGSTIVEVSNHGLGRNPEALQQISRETGVNVIMGCGWYYEGRYEPRFYEMSTNEVAAEMVRDLTRGVGETGIRAGVIGEIGSDRGRISPAEERSFRAAARAHKQTGVSITTHAHYSTVGLDQLDLLEEEGVDPRRVIVGHSDSHPEPDYHEALAKRGAYVQFDNVRGMAEWDTQCRVDWIKRLIAAGYLRQILLSQDVCTRAHYRAYGGTGYDYVVTEFSERLRAAKLSQGEIETLLIVNPREALTGQRVA